MDGLLAAIQNTAPWLGRFQKLAYREAFQEYRAAYGDLYGQALRDEEPEELAEALLNALEEGWKRHRRWSRTAVRMDEKQMLVVYLTPMLLEEEPEGPALAEALQSAWAARWPREAYQIGRFEEFQRGFRTTILGVPIQGAGEE